MGKMAEKNDHGSIMKKQYSAATKIVLMLMVPISIFGNDFEGNLQEELLAESEHAQNGENSTNSKLNASAQNGKHGQKGKNGQNGGHGGNGANSWWGKGGDGGNGGDAD